MDAVIKWFSDKFSELLQWVYDFFQWLGQTIFAGIMDALASVLEAIPVPAFFNQAAGFFDNIPDSVAYFLNMFAVGEGIAMILAALVLRFLIRRIPIIG